VKTEASQARFRAAYSAHREGEGRRTSSAQLMQLPYLADGPFARQWSVRARTYDAFVTRIVRPMLLERGPIRLLDLGAGNGWLSRRVALEGVLAVAVDFREDSVDGLGAASAFFDTGEKPFHRTVASFDALPMPSGQFDIVVFNASLHYALDLGTVLHEAHRTLRPRGKIAILDSPFYRKDEDGKCMVAEKRGEAAMRFGDNAGALMSLPIIEYLTPGALAAASQELRVRWRRHRVWYPLWYELRPLIARARRRRAPSRFDLWESVAV
jgi:SAM-dependent methyltransferase